MADSPSGAGYPRGARSARVEYAKSELCSGIAAKVEDLIARDSKHHEPLTLATRYAVPFAQQTKMLTWKMCIIYWYACAAFTAVLCSLCCALPCTASCLNLTYKKEQRLRPLAGCRRNVSGICECSLPTCYMQLVSRVPPLKNLLLHVSCA
jgi:hypothetical protein